MIQDTLYSQVAAYFTYTNENNLSISTDQEGKKISRIYQNCVSCNTQKFASLKEMQEILPGQTRQFCGKCWSKMLNEFKDYMEPGNKSTPAKKEQTCRFELIFNSFYKK